MKCLELAGKRDPGNQLEGKKKLKLKRVLQQDLEEKYMSPLTCNLSNSEIDKFVVSIESTKLILSYPKALKRIVKMVTQFSRKYFSKTKEMVTFKLKN